MQQLIAVVHGYVQGVGFRASTQQKAGRLNLTGWVANQWDGSVKVVAEGTDNNLQLLLDWLQHGPPAARVHHVEAAWAAGSGEFRGFQIRR